MVEPTSTGWYRLPSGAPPGQQTGPLAWEQLYALASSGYLRPEDLVWHLTLPQWVPAAQIPGLFPAAAGLVHARRPLIPAQPYSVAYSIPPKSRPSWLWPVLIPVIALLLGGAALGAYFGATRGGDDGVTADTATAINETTSTGESTTTSTEAPVDLGKAESIDGDPALVVETQEFGAGPADQVLVLMAQGQGREQAEAVAAQISGTIVGEVAYIQLYQIQTSGTTAQDLEAAIHTASAQPGVEAAFPNAIMSEAVTIEGKKCSPLRDPLYDGANGIPYEMIGVQRAWDIIKASGIELTDVHLGIVDSVLNTKSGQGFGTELNFPDANGNYPAGQAKITGLDAKDTTDQPDPHKPGGLSHCTQATHVMVASADNGGVVGILGPAGDKVTMTQGNYQAAGGSYPAPNPDATDITQYQGFFLGTLVELKKQVEAKATVINMSFGSDRPRPQNQGQAAAFKRFFEQMQKDHPEVVFVAAAGNENDALDGANYGPGGLSLPNVITVGALDQTGDRATADDWAPPEKVQQLYDNALAKGTIPAETTLEQYTAAINKVVGSNYVTGNGEVTLSACGTQVPTGVDAEGKPVLSDGTSFAAPQVAAAAALLKTINPKLSAQDIKDILASTADYEVAQPDGSTVEVPEEMGAGVLRVDKAVLQVINDMRPDDDQLDMDDLIEFATVHLVAEGGPDEYTVTASITKVGPAGADMTISVTGQGVIVGSTTQHLSGPGQVSWKVTPKEDSTTIKVYRSDTKTCAVLTIEKPTFAGSYKGTYVSGGGFEFSIDLVVDEGGGVTGQIYWEGPIQTATVLEHWTWDFSFTGVVTADGRLTASGPEIHTSDVSSDLTFDAELNGQITDGTITAEWLEHWPQGDSTTAVTATLQ